MKRTTKLSFYFIIFIIFGLIGYFMPLTGDDLNWGSYWGNNYFPQGHFLTYDGRYLGDLLVIVMTKVKPVAFVAYGLFSALIVFMIQKIRDQLNKPKFIGLFTASIMATFLIIAPKSIFRQTLGWHAGFANYVPSVIFPLFLLYLFIKNYDKKEVHYYRTILFLSFLASVLTQLFAEHMTILNCFISVVIWLFFRKHFYDGAKKLFNYILLGNFIGAILMFINGAYIKILTGSDSYRHVTGSSAGDTIIGYMKHTYTPKFLVVISIATLIFIGAVIFYTYNLKDFKRKIVNYSLLIFAAMSVLPFLVVSPFGSRCMFASFIFSAAIIAINFDLITERFEKILLPIMTIIFLIVGIRMDYLAHDYGHSFNTSIDYTNYQNTVDRGTYYMLQYRDTNYIWLPAPVENDAVYNSLYVRHPERKFVAINYWDWTDAMRKAKAKNPSRDDLMKEFDKQIKHKVKLINEKNSK
ncbi:DUF6056 family protein [Companilactobacillus baiquanensis]|uniref:DUF6056 family protein n=1 Tax=Companilactobacillus baiquanensis TaxID=2486005 RepID=A0ABW1UZ88_9LACO|nr:DUF6056 family protein [Companilactobacillus baiquanensis]